MWALTGGTPSIDTIEFPIPLSKADAEDIEIQIWTPTAAGDCEGSPVEPTAPPGVLCLYHSINEPPTLIAPEIYNAAVGFATNGVGTSGAILYQPSLTAGNYQIGSFAVTAP